MYRTRKTPGGTGTKYYLESFLREDFLQYGIILRTDENGAVTGLSFNSHNLGTVDIDAGRRVQCFRWEDEEEIPKTSPTAKHYPAITGVRERDKDFARAVVGEVLDGIGNEYLQQVLSDFFYGKGEVRLDPGQLPERADTRVHADAIADNSPAKVFTEEELQRTYRSTGNAAAREAGAVKIEPHDSKKPGQWHEATPEEEDLPAPAWAVRRVEAENTADAERAPDVEPAPRAPAAKTSLYERFSTWRLRMDVLIGVGLLAAIIAAVISIGDARLPWLTDRDDGLFCNPLLNYCLNLERLENGPVLFAGLVQEDNFRKHQLIDIEEPAPNFFVSARRVEDRKRCFALAEGRLLSVPCLLNEQNYGKEFILLRPRARAD